ncbi:MAG: transposase [Oscillospiraceae bacterium]
MKNLSDSEKATLKKLSFDCRTLYNRAIHELDSDFMENKKCGTAAWLERQLSNCKEYLGPGYVPTLRQASGDFYRSMKTGHSRPKEQQRPAAILCQPIVNGRFLTVPRSPNTDKLTFELTNYLIGKQIVGVAIRPLFGDFQQFEIVITYRKRAYPQAATFTNSVGIDLGIENFATLACSNGSTMIVDGRRLKSILRLDYQKQKTGDYGSKQETKRTNQITDYIGKSVQLVLQFCIKNEVAKVAIGSGMPSSELRRNGCKNFWPHFPFSKFQSALIAKLNQHNIKVVMVDEAYTSQASFLDGDFVPWHISRSIKAFSGKRIQRGLYRSATGILLNADVNGAYNILTKFSIGGLSQLRNNPKLIVPPQRVDPLKL